MTRLKAISESITMLILISITLITGYLIYRGYMLRISTAQSGISEATRVASSRIAEKIDIIDAYIDVTTNNLTIIIYNYGNENITIEQLIVPVIVNGSVIKTRIFHGDDIVPNVLPRRDLVEVMVNINRTGDDLEPGDRITYPPRILVKIAMFTDSGRRYEFYARTVIPG